MAKPFSLQVNTLQGLRNASCGVVTVSLRVDIPHFCSFLLQSEHHSAERLGKMQDLPLDRSEHRPQDLSFLELTPGPRHAPAVR